MLMALVVVIALCLVPVCRSGMIGMALHGLLIVIFGAFAAFFWRETPDDERDITHQMFAGRVAFFVSMTLLLGWMLWQLYVMRAVDPVLAAIIIVTILAKIIAHSYSQRYC